MPDDKQQPTLVDPPTLDEFYRLTMLAHHLEGRGMETTVHTPCPFCAAPGFMTYGILEVQAVTSQEHTCAACGRSAKFSYFGTLPEQVIVELVQTGGPEPPDWLDPKPRRIALYDKGDAK